MLSCGLTEASLHFAGLCRGRSRRHVLSNGGPHLRIGLTSWLRGQIPAVSDARTKAGTTSTRFCDVMERQETRQRKKAPVFVLGAPRSGTTLLYHMLLSAGGFAVYRSESEVFSLLEPKFGDFSVPRNKQRLLRLWLESKLFRLSGLSREQISKKILAECRNGGDFIRIFMQEIARSQNAERWADCTPDHLLYLPRIKETIPDALVIHIIRDGRDVAQSLVRQGWIRPFPWDKHKSLLVSGLFWEWIVSKGRRHGHALGSDYCEVHFEALIAEPRKTLIGLGRFIDHDLNYDRILQVGIGSVREPNTSFAKDLQQSEFNPVGRWRSLFTDKGLTQFEALVGNFLETLGYPLAVDRQPLGTIELRTMRALYRAYFNSRLWLKAKTPLGQLLTNVTSLK